MNRASFVLFLAIGVLPIFLFAPAINAQPLSGTKTIGGTEPDYTTFTAAATDLRTNGVGTGGVTFNVRPGTYAEHCSLTTISGASQTNQIIFHATSGTVTLNNSSFPNTGARVGVELYGARWVTFDGIDVADSMSGIGTYYQVGFALLGAGAGAQHNTVENCTITLNRQNDSSFAIYGLGYSTDDSVTCSYNRFLNLRITNCQHGIFLTGGSGVFSHDNEIGSTSPGVNFAQRTIIGSGGVDDIGSHGAYGILANYQNNLLVHDIDVRNIFNNYEAGDQYQSAMQFGGTLQNYSIYGCRIYNNRNATSANISMNGMRLATSSGSTVHVYNNFVYNFTNSVGLSAPTGVYLRGILIDVGNTGTLYIDNNTIITDHAAADMTTSSVSTNGSGSVYVRNNIMANRSTGQSGSTAMHRCLSGLPTSSDHNVFYLPDTNNGVFAYSTAGINYTTLPSWQAVGQDSNSQTGNPIFVNDTSNFHLQIGGNSPAESHAMPVTWITTDIDGDARDPVMPDIGADETPSRATLVLLAPVGGEAFPPGIADTIRWRSNLITGNIHIELNRSYPAGTWQTVTASTANTGSYVWVPTLPITSHGRIRITSIDSSFAGDTCRADFSIGTFNIALLHPNGGENVSGLRNDTIRWSATSYPGTLTVRMTLNYPAGPWTTLGTNVPLSASSFVWTVPNTPTTNARVAIVPDSLTALADTSETNFSITRTTIDITHPNGNEVLSGWNSDTVRWSQTPITGTATVRMTMNYPGGTWTTLGTNIPLTDSRFGWVVPNTPTATARIAVIPDSFPALADTSAADFSINLTTVVITHPNGGDSLVAGTRDTIRWNPIAYTGTATIRFISVYPFSAWTTIATGVPLNPSRVAWIVPNMTTDWARIAVIPDSMPEIADTSAENFSIVQYHVVILSPNGGDTLYAGIQDTIRWIPNRATGNCILLYNTSFPSTNWQTIASNISLNLLEYPWTVPNILGSTTRVRIIPITTPQYADTSDANFSIASPRVVISHPNGGDTLSGNSSDTIRWAPHLAQGTATIKFNGNYPSGIWTTVASNVALAVSQFIWNVPNQGTNSARIAIVPDNYPSFADTSDANFSVLLNGVNDFWYTTPEKFAIKQAYPNPFNNELQLTIAIPTQGKVDITVTDLLGREVAQLFSGTVRAGYLPYHWRTNRLASGEYLLRVRFGQSQIVRKVVYLK